ncbi:MAG: hypothetical protein BMS9Abin19_0920 [Gammaproteobacteria bacterium]|nr:MAG: hypothetical protein BMS9Abin19_0920 [Gammaproteobacteria bacterium]
MRTQDQVSAGGQQGIALLIMIIVIALTAITFFISSMSTRDIVFENQLRTIESLKKAKRALLAYAANYPEQNPTVRGPGYLPCPDSDNDGRSETGCNPAGVVSTGRFPWATVGTGDLRDGDSERLWYAVSEMFDYTSSPSVNKINSQTTGNLTLRDKNNNILFDGTGGNAAVAVIIAPGASLVRDDGIVQNRSPGTGDPNDPTNYLDTVLAIGEDNASFQHGTLDGFVRGVVVNGSNQVIVNDVIEVITYDEIMEVIHRRVAGELTNALIAYTNVGVPPCINLPDAAIFDPTRAAGLYISDAGVRQGHIPVDSPDWAGGGCADGLLPDWVEAEEWHKVSYYHFAASVPCAIGVDCLSVNNSNPAVNNADALIVFAGRDLNGVRHINNISEYYENENADFDLVYDAAELEDSIWVISP